MTDAKSMDAPMGAPKGVRRRRAVAGTALLGVVLAVSFLTGCGGNDGDAGTPGGGDGTAQTSDAPTEAAGDENGGEPEPDDNDGDQAGLPPCPDAAQVTAATGHDMVASDEAVPDNYCAYTADAVDVYYIYLGSMRSQIEQRLDAGFDPVPGVGEEATWNADDRYSGQLAVRTGDDVGYAIEIFAKVLETLDLRAMAIELAQLVIDG